MKVQIYNASQSIKETLEQSKAHIENSEVHVTLIEKNNWTEAATKTGTLEESVSSLSTNVEELFQSVSNGKSLVANAITEKGVNTEVNAEFATLAANIGKIPTGAKYATGNVSSTTKRVSFYNPNASTITTLYVVGIDLNTIGFSPNLIVVRPVQFTVGNTSCSSWHKNYYYYQSPDNFAHVSYSDKLYREYKVENILYIPVNAQDSAYTWQAYE